VCLHRILPISGLDMLITDKDAPEDIRQASRDVGFELLLA
jgi:DeoR family transcriptional regulator of aga operon